MNHRNSGLAHGTNGSPQFTAENYEAAIVAHDIETKLVHDDLIKTLDSRVKTLDLREHAIKYSQLSKKKLEIITKKIENRTATKDEYNHFKWNRRFNNRRERGIRRFWRQERERLINNAPSTRNWTKEQKEAILAGKRPKFKGATLVGHHIYSASNYPHLADKGEIIVPVTSLEHLKGWHGGKYKNSLPGKPLAVVIEF